MRPTTAPAPDEATRPGSRRSTLASWRRFVCAQGHVIRRHPQLLFQQAANEPAASPVAGAAMREWNAGRRDRPWWFHVNRPHGAAPLLTLNGHRGAVHACVFLAGGQRLASASDDGTIRIWDLARGVEVLVLDAGAGPVRCCAVSPDGRRLAAAGDAGAVWLWDLQSAAVERVLTTHDGPVTSCAWSPDGLVVLSASADRTARACDAATGRACYAVRHERSGIRACAVSPDGGRIVTATGTERFGGELRVWDARTGQPAAWFMDEQVQPYRSCGFSADGRTIVAASLDTERPIQVWDAAASGGAPIRTSPAFPLGVNACVTAADGRTIVGGADDLMLRIWDASTLAEIARLGPHPGPVTSCAISPDGAMIAAGTRAHSLLVWDARIASAGLDERYGGPVSDCGVSPDGQLVVSVSRQRRTVCARDGATGGTLGGLPDAMVIDSRQLERYARLGLSGMDPDPDARRAFHDAVMRQEGTISLAAHHDNYVAGVRWSPDGTTLATASIDSRVWRASDGREVLALDHDRPVVRCRWSPDGSRLAVVDDAGLVILWRTTDGEASARIASGSDDGIADCAWSPDGRWLLTATFAGVLALWPAEDAADRATDAGAGAAPAAQFGSPDPEARNAACAWSPDGRLVAAAIGNGVVRVYRVGTGDLVRETALAGRRLTSCLFSPDGRWLVLGTAMRDEQPAGSGDPGRWRRTRAADQSVLLWSLDDGAIAAEHPVGSVVTVLVPHPRGFGVVTGDTSGHVALLRPVGIDAGMPQVTAGRQFSPAGRQWTPHVTVRCGWCARLVPVPAAALQVIEDVRREPDGSRNDCRLFGLPDHAWDDDGLSMDCPVCRRPLRLNPFVMKGPTRVASGVTS